MMSDKNENEFGIEDSLSDFELESYICRYDPDSEGRLQRLLFIAQCTSGPNDSMSSSGMDTSNHTGTTTANFTATTPTNLFNSTIASSAYQLALTHMKAHGNVTKYKEIFGFNDPKQNNGTTHGNNQDGDYDETMDSSPAPFNTPSSPSPIESPSASSSLLLSGVSYDEEWALQTTHNQQIQLETLESRLSTARAHLNKEAIRTAFLALSDFYLKTGRWKQAMKYLNDARDYCTGNARFISLCLDIATIAICSDDWRTVEIYIKKAENTITTGMAAGASSSTGMISGSGAGASTGATNSPNPDGSMTLAKIHCIAALGHMKAGQYAQAALKFASISPDLTNQFHSVILPEDIALYGSLLGLASLDRYTLRTMIIESNVFAQRLELLPKMRDSLRFFERADYGQGLRLLHSMEAEMRLDIHLSPHVDTLFTKIKERCMVFYFYPYSKVSLKSMGESFFMTVEDVEEAVEKLILEGRIQGARINAKEGTLLREGSAAEKGGKLLRRVKKMGDRFMSDADSMILSKSKLYQCCSLSYPVNEGKQPR